MEGGDTLRYPLNMGTVGPDGGLRNASPFPFGAERRSAEENIAALAFAGVAAEHYTAMEAGIRAWLREDGSALLLFLAQQPECRSAADAGRSLIEKVKSYYADLEAHMPEDLQRAIDDISAAAYTQAAQQLGSDAPPRDWFNGRLKYFYGDEMERLKHVNAAEVERIIKDAIGQDKSLWGVLNQRISGWPEDRAEALARTEAAFTQNKMLIRTIRKAGYLAVWHTAPGCCALCQKMDGVVVTTLSPPLHPGCCCTVRKGARNEGYNDPHPESDAIVIPPERLKHSAYGDFTENGRMKNGGHLWSTRAALVSKGINCPILVEYPNGVTFGNVSNHKEKPKRESGVQAWFPKSWTEETLEKAGKHVYTVGEEVDGYYGKTLEAVYAGVNVRVTVFPLGTVDNVVPSYDQPGKEE